MNRIFALLTGVWMFVIAIPAPSAAAVIYSNFGPGSSYNASQGNPIGNAFDLNNYAEGDTFVLSGDAIFSSVRIALSCFASCTDSFSVTLNQDAGNQPGATIETFAVPAGALGTLGANNAPLVLTSVVDPSLTYHTRYWIVVAADLNDSIDWNLNLIGDSAAEALSADGGTSWYSPSGNTPGSFEIDGITPEPASAGLVLGAGLLLSLIGKRRSR